MNHFEDEAERAHFKSVVSAYKQYKKHSIRRIAKSLKFIENLPESHQRRLSKYKESLHKFGHAVDVNEKIIQLIIKDVECLFQNAPLNGDSDTSHDDMNGDTEDLFDNEEMKGSSQEDTAGRPAPVPRARPWHHDYEKVQSVLKQLVRDWSSLGATEREQCYKPIVDEIIRQFPSESFEPSDVNILVPGAGLGRLAWEIANRGYACQGNEFSLFMLFASNFVLNRCTEVNEYTINPWLHQFVNNLSCSHQLATATIPDVEPSIIHHTKFSMAAGDFLKVYREEDAWHCVATCFFIDCAPNVIDFIETIYKILKPGGVWINLGPLLYHYSDLPTEDSIEPPFDILMEMIQDVGFIVEKSKTGVKTKYAQNPNSMLQYEYDSVFFVCTKPNPTV